MLYNRKIKSSHSSSKPSYRIISITFIISLVTISIVSLLYITLKNTQEKVLASYHGRFGLYGETLTLFKNGSLTLRYHGCSQSKGAIKGSWTKNNGYYHFDLDEKNDFMDSIYYFSDSKLIPDDTSQNVFYINNDEAY